MRKRRRQSKPQYWASNYRRDPRGRRWWWLCRNAEYGWCGPQGDYSKWMDSKPKMDHSACGWAQDTEIRNDTGRTTR